MNEKAQNPLAGKPPAEASLINIPRLVTAYYSELPDPQVVEEKVSFGTSGHRGCSFNRSFNHLHVVAISQAICDYRNGQGINGPLFLGIDTHALSEAASSSAIEVLAANDVQLMLALNDEYTPTPAVSHAILVYNQGRTSGLADGVVITPSHNPPQDGGFKYNPPNGGPADTTATKWIENKANEYLVNKLAGVKKISLQQALKADTTHRHDYLNSYVADLENVVDLKLISASKLKLGVDPLGGAGVHYWPAIAERYGLNLTIVNKHVDPTFRFMTLDWDAKIRMDPSSTFAMQSLIKLKDQFDLAFACDPDHDRHGIVAPSVGLLPSNHYLSVCIDYLFQNRPQWDSKAAVGKTLVSSQLIDRVAESIGRKVLEVPVGFKWFVDGLIGGSLGFGGEESAGASFSRMNGKVWTTDKDGLIPALLSAEITARSGKDPGTIYKELTDKLGEPFYDRVEAPANTEQKKILSKLSPTQIDATELAGEKITAVLDRAPGNDGAIGGLKVTTKNGWFAARPSGTENIYKIYAESFLGKEHLTKLIGEAQSLVDSALGAAQS